MTAPESLYQRIAPDVKLGQRVKIFAFTNLYGCEIGDDVKIGTFVEIQKGARVGHRCKVSSHTFVCEGVMIEDEVFIGHGVTFINDRIPRSTNIGGGLQTEADWKCIPTLVNARGFHWFWCHDSLRSDNRRRVHHWGGECRNQGRSGWHYRGWQSGPHPASECLT